MLLNKEADVNAQGGKYGNALQAASNHGHDIVVQMLLNKGADVNAQPTFTCAKDRRIATNAVQICSFLALLKNDKPAYMLRRPPQGCS